MRLWRWRRNPLRRRSDVIEAWIMLVGWAVAVLAGLLTGLVAAGAVERAAEQQRAERHQVAAVLVEDAEDQPARAAADDRVWAAVRWAAPDGAQHTDDARVPARTPAGSTVTVWTDGRGQIAAEPLTPGETVLHAVSGAVLAGAGASAAALGTVRVARWGLERRRLAQWAAEWRRIDTGREWNIR
ncbi:hypothetical protein [Streptomyces sp. TRM68367]|uniref:Rv1733c family protein n=1 Tax=Streptomyces sp. TRM68367 TaxID=2758415 RepID=UPI002934701F|nr:hypothetical protein [Streptomyces sp. TRM68367]